MAVRINPVNDAPVAHNDSGTGVSGEPITVSVLANDVDVDGDSLTVVSVTKRGPGTATTNGTTVTYQGPRRSTTTVTITYTVCDPAGACSSAAVTITQGPGERPPNAVDDTAQTNSNGKATIRVTRNDSDPDLDLDNVSVTIVTGPSHGIASTFGIGTVRYQANPGFSGTDSFVYRVCDTTNLCDTATVTITVPD